MPASDMPAAEVDVDESLVRALLEEQHPDLATLPLRLAANGWDNVVYRLGEELSVRLPRRQLGAELILHEQRWLPAMAARLPLPIPVPVRIGVPGAGGYPWHWSVCPWLPGAMAATSPPDDLEQAAVDLGGFVAAMHQPAPTDAPANPYRGVPLAQRDPVTRERLVQLHDLVDIAAAERRWRSALDIEPWDGPPLWLHGDLHPANLLVHEGRLSAVLDFGDLTAGDPASDLSVAWMLFPDDRTRALFRAAAGQHAADDRTWARARGWALQLALAFVAGSADNPVIAGIGRRTLAAVLP